MIMIDPDDVCNHADSVRADIIAKLVGRLGLEKTMFEATNPQTSEWFIKRYGPKVSNFLPTTLLKAAEIDLPTCIHDCNGEPRFCLQVNLFVDHSQVMDLECLRGCNLGKNHASVLSSSYFLL